jgi:hypothetical protein
VALIGCSPAGSYPTANLQASTSATSASALAISATTLTTLTTLTTHAPGRWLVLRLLLQAARRQTASLPPARSSREPGCLGDAVGRFLLRFALELHRTPFAAAVAGCAPPRCVTAPRPELEKAWLFGRRNRPLSASIGPCILLTSPPRLAR